MLFRIHFSLNATERIIWGWISRRVVLNFDTSWHFHCAGVTWSLPLVNKYQTPYFSVKKGVKNIPATDLKISCQCCFWNTFENNLEIILEQLWTNPGNAREPMLFLEQALHNVCNQDLSQPTGLKRLQLQSFKRVALQWIAQIWQASNCSTTNTICHTEIWLIKRECWAPVNELPKLSQNCPQGQLLGSNNSLTCPEISEMTNCLTLTSWLYPAIDWLYPARAGFMQED